MSDTPNAPSYLRAPEAAAWRAGYRSRATGGRNPYNAVTDPARAWTVADLRSAWMLGRRRADAEAAKVLRESVRVDPSGQEIP